MDLMIVDDSKMMRDVILDICKQFNVLKPVAVVSDGQQAVAEFIKHRPQLITMDLTMPKLDGISAILKIIEIDPTVKILVISAVSDVETAIKALSSGARGFLLKPFSREDLTEYIIEILKEK
mgnify:CR=1 FL=1